MCLKVKGSFNEVRGEAVGVHIYIWQTRSTDHKEKTRYALNGLYYEQKRHIFEDMRDF
jgi:hypothetical protein